MAKMERKEINKKNNYCDICDVGNDYLQMLTDKDKFLKEIEKLENALYRKLNPKMLVETRCEERLYRAGVEMCLDKTTIGLHKEQFDLDNTIKMLNDKLNKTK